MIKIVDNIILFGTSHVQKDVEIKLKEVFEKYDVSLLTLELDISRFRSLMSDEKRNDKFDFKLAKEIGFFGYSFAYLAGKLQRKIGASFGIEPGIDMKTAYLLGKEKKIPTALIDQDIKKTLKNLSSLKFTKKIKMFYKIFMSGFKKENKKLLEIDMKDVPKEKEIIMILDLFKKEVPDLYKILIEDRNEHMVNRLMKLKEEHTGFIIAVLGAGHLAGMEELLKNNLKQKIIENKTNDSNNFSLNFKVDI